MRVGTLCSTWKRQWKTEVLRKLHCWAGMMDISVFFISYNVFDSSFFVDLPRTLRRVRASMQIRPLLVAISTVFAACALTTAKGAVIYGSTADRELNEGNLIQTSATGPTLRAGASGSSPAGGRNALVVFQLPDFGAVSNPFLTVDFGIHLATLTGTPAYNVDLYGLGLQSTDTLTVGSGALATNRFYEADAVDPNATLIQLDFTTPATNALGFKNTDATADLALTSYLNTLYASGAGANQFVVFRLNPDANLGSPTLGYNYSSADAGDGTAFDPVLTYTAVPEPSASVMLIAGASLIGFIRRRR